MFDTTGRFSRGIGRLGRVLVAGALLAAPLSTPATAQEDLGAIARLVVEASTEDELSRALATLGQRQEVAGSVRSAATKYEQSLKKREEDRKAKLDEVDTEFEEHLTKAREAKLFVDRAVALADAMRSAVEMQILTVDESALLADPRIKGLIVDAESAAEKAEAQGEWMLSNELYAMLSALFEDEGAYQDDVDRLNQRLAMIRLYAPQKFRDLIAEHRTRHGEDPPPPYNPYGDGFEEKLAPITSRAVERSLQQAAFQHVDMASKGAMGPMLIGGLTAVESLVTTSELAEALPALADAQARDEFVAVVRSLRERVRDRMDDPNRGVGLAEMGQVMNRLMATNRFTLELSEQALLHEFGNGAMTALDEYSAIIWPDEIKRFQRSTQGEFVGVGIQIEMDDMQNIRVVTPLEGTPAQQAGIQTGDLIKKVDGHSTIGFTLDQAVEVITGPRDTSVTLTVEREVDGNKKDLDFTLERKRIELPTVRGWHKTGAGDDVDAWDWFVDPEAGIGYIRITSFSNNTTDRFDEAIEHMRRRGLNGLVLDLRFNPGGLLDEAVSIANRFVDEGMIVKTEDAAGRVRSTEVARRLPGSRMVDDIPVTVLVNEGSASASEIVSGAIQAEARAGGLDATVVGRRTFGKGSVQNVFSLTADQSAMMKLTTQYYKLRGDRIIHRKPGAPEWGIEPDIEVEMLPDQIVEAARIRRDADVLAIDEQGRIIPDEDRPHPSELLEVGGDLQLQTALVLLQSRIHTGETAVTAAD